MKWQQVDVDRKGNGLFISEDGDKTVFKVVEDCQPLLDFNQEKKSNESGNWRGDMHHVASIPASLWQEWWREFGGNPNSPENRPKLMRKLNERDYSKLRVKSGRL